MWHSHSASMGVPHVLAQVDHATPQSVESRADAATRATAASAQPIPIPQRKTIQVDYAEIQSVDVSIRDAPLLLPQALRQGSSQSPKTMIYEGRRLGRPSVFRKSARHKRDFTMSKPIFLGTPFEVPDDLPLGNIVPGHSLILHQRGTRAVPTNQEISIIVPSEANLPETSPFVPLPAPNYQASQLQTGLESETNIGPSNPPHNDHREVTTPIITRPSSSVPNVPEYSGGGPNVFAAGTKRPLFVPRDLRSRVIFHPFDSPLPSIPIILDNREPDIQVSTKRIVLAPISAWRSAIPHHTNFAPAPLPGIHTILSPPETLL